MTEQLTKKELLEIARKIQLKGRSNMNKKELLLALFPKTQKRINPRLSPLKKNELTIVHSISNDDIKRLGEELNLTFKYKKRESRINQISKELADRMCKCIKEIHKKTPRIDESRSIAICRSSVLKKRGVDLYTFKCKDEKGKYSPKLSPKKGTKSILKIVK